MPKQSKAESVPQWAGTLTEFVRKHADFAASPVRPHLEDLTNLAHESGLNSTLATVAGVYYLEKRKQWEQAQVALDTKFQAGLVEMLDTDKKRSRRRPRRRSVPRVEPIAAAGAEVQPPQPLDLNGAVGQMIETLRTMEEERARLRGMLLAIREALKGPPAEQ